MRREADADPVAGDPLWFKDAIVYELHVRGFRDSDGDGFGDFGGLIEKLDYLQELGVTALWLLPFYPSPLRDDGYDIADYLNIHPSYGTLRDFRRFVREAHRRDLRVITELVLNHTSDQHPWFRRARRSPRGSLQRDFYVWSDTPERYREARIIFSDFEASNWTWDQEAGQYYWHRFYSHQPDLNYDSPRVRRRMLDIVDFWLSMGVDGMRLDAVPYLFERDDTSCENLPETIAFLRELRAHVDRRYPNRLMLAEANQWPEDAVAYFGEGDVCHMAFHFPLMPRMFMAVRMEDRFPIVDILAQTPSIPDACQWALFLRNHDELTLEMVTDEERDYMYRVFAQDPQTRINLGIRRRLAPLLGNDRKLIELMNGLLFALPGTPFLYYGDEIGMGDNVYLGDRNGVRTPMQWSADRNAGFSLTNAQRLYLPVVIDPEYHYEAVNVEAQQANANSLYWWMRRLIGLRRRHPALGRGSLEFLYPENRKVLVFLREYGEERILVVASLSRRSEYVELPLQRFAGATPVEMFGRTEFPRIGELPYLLTLGPHGFYWFSLQPAPQDLGALPEEPQTTIQVSGPWESLFASRARASLEAALPDYLRAARWFAGKDRRIRSVTLRETVPLAPAGRSGSGAGVAGVVALAQVEYVEGESETYALPLATLPPADDRSDRRPPVLARLRMPDGEAMLVDGLWVPEFGAALADAVLRRRRLRGRRGTLAGRTTATGRRLAPPGEPVPEPAPLGAEQSNTTLAFGDRLVLKFFRRPEPGPNPELELGRFLTERAGFEHVPPLVGSIEHLPGRGEAAAVAIVHGYLPNEGLAWDLTVDAVGHYLEEAVTLPGETLDALAVAGRPLELAALEEPPVVRDAVGSYLESARLLGRRTAELHLALASDRDDPAFRPEPFTALDQRSLAQATRTTFLRAVRQARPAASSVPEVAEVLEREQEVLARVRTLLSTRIHTQRIRIHGDYHLGQVLHTGRDFAIIDFEGEPARPLSARRIKRPALEDVAGMLRSFDYAMRTALVAREPTPGGPVDPVLAAWGEAWCRWVSAAFLRSYLEVAGDQPFLPRDPAQVAALLDVHLLGKAAYEIGYEAGSRPELIAIPAAGMLRLLADPPSS